MRFDDATAAVEAQPRALDAGLDGARRPAERREQVIGPPSARGMIWRVIQSDEGDLTVEVLQDGEWIRGRTGLVGLRLDASTTQLTEADIRQLPA